jgi:small subunit ribosomal protein S18
MARPRRSTKRDAPDRKPKKKVSILDTEGITWVDYKDVALLRRFMSERAKIRARRVTGNDAQQQRAGARAIRVAREMALLPYSVRQVTHRSKGKRDRGDRDSSGPPPRPESGPPTHDDAPRDDAPRDDAPRDDAPRDDAPRDDAPPTEAATVAEPTVEVPAAAEAVEAPEAQ